MEVRTREYRGPDRTALVRLMEELQDYTVSIDNLKKVRRATEFGECYAERTLKKVAENNGVIYVAEIKGRIIGLVVGIISEQTREDLLEHAPSKNGEVLELIVEADYREKGVGTILMNKMEEYFKLKNCDVSGIMVFVPNKNAYRLYNKLGYYDRAIWLTKEPKEENQSAR